MVMDYALLQRVGRLALHVVLTLVPLALCVTYLRYTRSYFQHRREDAVHNYKPGTKYFLVMGSVAALLHVCLSVPRLAAAGVLSFEVPAAVSSGVGVLATVCVHGHMLRQMFAGPQLSSFVAGQRRFGTRWRPAFGILLGISVLIVAGCEYLSFALDLVFSDRSNNPCTLGLARWWSALVIGCAGVTMMSSALLVRRTLRIRNRFMPHHVRVFALALLSGGFKLACALFLWKNDMYPISTDADLAVAQTFNLREDLLPPLVAYDVLFESLWYSRVAPPESEVRTQSRWMRVVSWLKTCLGTPNCSSAALQKPKHGTNNRRQDAHNFPHLYPHLRSVAVNREQSEEEAHRRMLAFASTVRGEFASGDAQFQIAGGLAFKTPGRARLLLSGSEKTRRSSRVTTPVEGSYHSKLGDLHTLNLWNQKVVQAEDAELSISERNPYAIGSHIPIDSPSAKRVCMPLRKPLRTQTEQNYRSPAKPRPPRRRPLSPLSSSTSSSGSIIKCSPAASPPELKYGNTTRTHGLCTNEVKYCSSTASTTRNVGATPFSHAHMLPPVPMTPSTSCPCDGHKKLYRKQRSTRSSLSASRKRSIFSAHSERNVAATKNRSPTSSSTPEEHSTVGKDIDGGQDLPSWKGAAADTPRPKSAHARASSKSNIIMPPLRSPMKMGVGNIKQRSEATGRGSRSGGDGSRWTVGPEFPERINSGVRERHWVHL